MSTPTWRNYVLWGDYDPSSPSPSQQASNRAEYERVYDERIQRNRNFLASRTWWTNNGYGTRVRIPGFDGRVIGGDWEAGYVEAISLDFWKDHRYLNIGAFRTVCNRSYHENGPCEYCPDRQVRE